MVNSKSENGASVWWGVVLLILAIIFVVNLFDDDSVNKEVTPSLDLAKSKVVYVTYEFSGRNADGSRFNSEASGSGVLFSKEGDKIQVVTNRHVVDCGYTDNCYQRTEEIVKIRVGNGKMLKASKVSYAPFGLDIAVVEIYTREVLTNDKDGSINYSSISIGDEVVAIGYPATSISNVLEFSVSSGKVTSKNQLLMKEGWAFEAISSDAYVNFGSSGGGLFDSYGNLVGITTWKSGDDKTAIAISAESLRELNAEQKYVYCESGSYITKDNLCTKYCASNEVLGADNKCYPPCSGFYCESQEFTVMDSRCPEGRFFGTDNSCHIPCGSPNMGCADLGDTCFKYKCINGCEYVQQ